MHPASVQHHLPPYAPDVEILYAFSCLASPPGSLEWMMR